MKDLVISVLVGFLLGVGAFQVGFVPSIAPAGAQGIRAIYSPSLPEKVITKGSSVEEILSLMLESNKMWHTLQAETMYQVKDPSIAEPDYIVK